MAWEIQLKVCSVDYVYDDESFEINNVKLKSSQNYQEPGGYKTPADDIIEEIYSAESEHGVFEWLVIAKRSGFDTYAEIEDVQLLKQPQGCDSDTPNFEISNS
jgi:hypothetical protein